MKRVLLAVLVLLICLSTIGFAAGNQESADGAEDGYTIATVVKLDGIAWFNRMRVGVNEFAAETGNDCFLIGPSESDAAAQVKIIEDLIAQGVDALCVVPFSVEATEPVLRKAMDAGIVVITHEASNSVNRDYDIEAFDNHAYGANMMKNLGAFMDGEGGYICTVGGLTAKSQNEWIDGAIAYQEEHFPNMYQVAPRIEEGDNPTTAYERIKEAIVAYPDLRGVLGGPMTTSAGAGLAVDEKGLQGEIFVCSTGLVSVARQYLESGAVQSIHFWDPKAAGIVMNELALMV
ncbi:MAG: substrate-binding domain-containing protein, partial [Spirochaetaceae bacterium]|nr:substrate-binding domain-containing protein [Spirochaetaceae bacterium]